MDPDECVPWRCVGGWPWRLDLPCRSGWPARPQPSRRWAWLTSLGLSTLALNAVVICSGSYKTNSPKPRARFQRFSVRSPKPSASGPTSAFQPAFGATQRQLWVAKSRSERSVVRGLQTSPTLAAASAVPRGACWTWRPNRAKFCSRGRLSFIASVGKTHLWPTSDHYRQVEQAQQRT